MLQANIPKVVALMGKAQRSLDVGGWHKPLNAATHVLDISPYETRCRLAATDPRNAERFTKDTWITSMEVRPGARAVVHHVCVSYKRHVEGVKYYTPEWQDKARDEEGSELPRTAPMPRAGGALSIAGVRLHCYVPGVAAVD